MSARGSVLTLAKVIRAANDDLSELKPEPVETVTSTGYDEWLREAKAASPDAESFQVPARFVGVGRLADDDEPVQEASTIRAEDLLARYSEITEAIEAGCRAKPFDPFAADKLSKQLHALLGEMAEEGARIRKERGSGR